jgi:hypothetical protein
MRPPIHRVFVKWFAKQPPAGAVTETDTAQALEAEGGSTGICGGSGIRCGSAERGAPHFRARTGRA